jgi:hypothetical protein
MNKTTPQAGKNPSRRVSGFGRAKLSLVKAIRSNSDMLSSEIGREFEAFAFINKFDITIVNKNDKIKISKEG